MNRGVIGVGVVFAACTLSFHICTEAAWFAPWPSRSLFHRSGLRRIEYVLRRIRAAVPALLRAGRPATALHERSRYRCYSPHRPTIVCADRNGTAPWLT